jgi:hypothetical protein
VPIRTWGGSGIAGASVRGRIEAMKGRQGGRPFPYDEW